MKRYKIVADIGPDDAWEKYEIDNGEWIKYEDHVAILAVAKEALGFYAERNNYIGGESYEIGIDENKLVMHPVS